MMYYRCDACGAEQKLLEHGVNRSHTDPLGYELTYLAPVAVRDQVKDLCKKCHGVFKERGDALREKQMSEIEVMVNETLEYLRKSTAN